MCDSGTNGLMLTLCYIQQFHRDGTAAPQLPLMYRKHEIHETTSQKQE